NIPSGNSVYCTDDFDISIAEDVLGGTELRLDIEIEDNAGNTWNDMIFLVVEGANLDVTDYTIDDANGYLDPGETVEMIVTLQNNGLVTANAVYGELTSPDSRVTVSDAEGYFSYITGEGGQGSNNADTFELTAGAQLVVGTQIMMELHLYNADGYDSTVQFLLGIGEVTITDPVGPDAYGYFCYDDGDIDYLSVPTYDWIEINTIGTNLNLYDIGDTGDIETINDLPITFRMYGEEYDSATVCSNGWIAPGGSTQASFMNSPIPGPQGPSPMIAPFWDDLKTASGDVYWYYDSSLHTLIIEWDHVQNDEDSNEETFQVILYDANYYPTITGDSQIKFQYKVINNTSAGNYPSQHGQYATVGLEDPSGLIGLEYTFNNTYPEAAKHLQNEFALLFTGPSIPVEIPFLVYGGLTIIDADGNGQADFGEDISLDVLLNNLGENPATNVSAEILSTDNYITINQATSAYNNVQGGGSASNQTYFEISVDEDCPDGHSANIEMNITSDEDTWILYFILELNSPIIEFETIFIDDGEDGIIDPGETADIYVSFINSGGSDAYNTISQIFESDPYVILNTSTYEFGTFGSGSIMTALYNVSVAYSAPVGHVADISVEIEADQNFSCTAEFELQIGFSFVSEGFESGDFDNYDWVMGGSANWVISTDAIEGVYSAKSGTITHNQHTDLQLTMDVLSDGEISFYRKVSSENNYDYLEFYIDGAMQEDWAGTVGWSQVTYFVQEGTRTFKWVYDKDGSVSTGSDCAWIDNIIFPPSGAISDMGFIEGNVTLIDGNGNVEDVFLTAGTNITHPDVNGDYILALPAGTYDIIASLDGYDTITEYDVQIVINQTEVIDFELTSLQAPEGLIASVSSNDVMLEWNMAAMRTTSRAKANLNSSKSQMSRMELEDSNSAQTTTRSLIGFKLYRNSTEIVQINDPSLTSYGDMGLDSGDYSYYVTALYDDNFESLPSNSAEITVMLDPPVNLSAQAQQPDIVLNWDAPTDLRVLTGYKVYRNSTFIIDVTEITYTDMDLPLGTYTYYITGMYGQFESIASNEVSVELTESDDPQIPIHTKLIGNYPNPFNPETKIEFSLLEARDVDLVIYNIKGEKIKKLVDGKMAAGFHSAVWNGEDDFGKKVASGIYLYRFKTDEIDQTKKMMLIK
ncbi:MAG: FlgD immunoglobulin-like domain containing protein, partial [Candidatus Tenebribacter mawsonii]|nr:FlgD immunoglobulin-like domain containing protein [Candidatus Tenebribacter mawsonii]